MSNANRNIAKRSKGKNPPQDQKGGGKAKNMAAVYKGKQGRKDSDAKRVNYDNARVDRIERDAKRTGCNDIEWYTRNPELLRSAASIPFASILGSDIFPFSSEVVPGVLAIQYQYAFGPTSEYDPYPYALNQAGRSMYSYLVHANSRNYTYEYQDLMILITAGAQIFSAISHAMRAYGTVKYYAEQSLYAPDALLSAMGFDPDDFRQNLGQIWFDLNDLINQTQQIWIPNTIPLIKRWFWLNSFVYRDAEGTRSQMYLFVPRGFYRYQEKFNTNGGGLEPAIYTNGSKTYEFKLWNGDSVVHNSWVTWKSMIQNMIDQLVNSEDRGIIFGDILNAYGADKLYSLSPIPADYRVEPVYNSEVLTQIENLTVFPGIQIGGLMQDPNGLKPCYIGTFNTIQSIRDEQVSCPATPVLNFHFKEQPTPEQITIATRLMSVGMETRSTTGQVFKVKTTIDNVSGPILTGTSQAAYPLPRACGSEIVTNVSLMIKYAENEGSPNVWNPVEVNFNKIFPYTYTMPLSDVTANGRLMAFDWHPFVYSLQPNADTSTSLVTQGYAIEKTLAAWGDYDNYTTVNDSMIKRLHEMALYSLYGVPQM